MLVYLLSKPDHWEVRVEDLLARTRNCLGKRSGRDKVYGILNELQMAGYVVRQYDRQGGTFKGVTYEVSETPDLDAGAAFIASQQKGKSKPIPANPETVAPVTDSPHTAQPVPANPDALVNNKQAVSIERAVKNLTADPVGANPAQSAVNAPASLGDAVGADAALSDVERKALSLAPDNYPQNPASKTFHAWLAYAMAFNATYRQWPIYNATVGGQMAKVVERIGQEVAPLTARYYVEAVKTPAIADNCHPISSLLRHCESYVVKAQAQAKQRARRADTERVVEAAAKAAPTPKPAVPAPAAGGKSEITNAAKQARALLGQIVGGPMKERLTA